MVIRIVQADYSGVIVSRGVELQIEAVGNRDDDTFLAQFAQSFVKIAIVQLPTLTKAAHIDGGVKLTGVVDLQGEENIVAVAGQKFELADAQKLIAIEAVAGGNGSSHGCTEIKGELGGSSLPRQASASWLGSRHL